MKLHHLPATSNQPSMLRLFDFDSADANELVEQLKQLAGGEIEQIPIHELPFTQCVNEVQLTAMVDERPRNPDTDFAILGGSATSSFIWRGTRDEWRETSERISAMAEHCDAESYLWLTEDLGVMLLMSPSGSW